MIIKKLVLTTLKQIREKYKYNQYAYTALVEAINEVEKIEEIKE